MPYVEDTGEFEISQEVMDQVRNALSSSFPGVVQVERSHFRVELRHRDKLCELMYITDVRQVFDPMQSMRVNVRMFDRFQDEVVHSEEAVKGVLRSIVLLVPSELQGDGALKMFASLVEIKEYSAVKYVLDYGRASQGLNSPFVPYKVTDARQPLIWVGHDTRNEWDTPVPVATVTATFRAKECVEFIDKVEAHPDADNLKALCSELVGRILGRSSMMVWTEEGPCLDFDNQGRPLHWSMFSAGEQRMLSFCLFLVAHYADRPDKECLYFPATLNGLDSVRYSKVMRCLRDYVICTGSSVLIATDVDSNKRLARFILGPLGEISQ
jgi:hypothetical protein